jgi:hypothetical protein
MLHNEVWLDDKGLTYDQAEVFFLQAEHWARTHCESFDQVIYTDMSDVSLAIDQLAEFRFKDEKDALMFRLKWLHQLNRST